MGSGRETDRLLGVVLVEQGVVTGDDIDGALAAQVETSQPLGEILLQRSLIVRPMLAKALAAQRGRSLEEEGGFGSGLMAKMEQLHIRRRGLQDEKPPQERPTAEVAETLVWEEPEYRQPELLRQRQEELDARERELEKQEARLALMERKLKDETAKGAPAKPAA